MGLGEWDNLNLAVVANTVRNERVHGGGVIELSEITKDHHIPVEENNVASAVIDGVGGGLLDEDGGIPAKKAMMSVDPGSIHDKVQLRSGGCDGLRSSSELRHPDHAALLEFDHGERTFGAVVGDVAADFVCRGLGSTAHAVVCQQGQCLVHGMKQVQGRGSDDIALAFMVHCRFYLG